MAKLNIKQIQQRACQLLDAAPAGLRWGEIHKAISEGDPETPSNTIGGALAALFSKSSDIIKVARGTYQLDKYVSAQSTLAAENEQVEEMKPFVVEIAGKATVTVVEK